MMRRLRFPLLLFCALVSSAANADAPHQLMWADLVPKSATMDNPFTKLTRDQLTWISDVAAVRDRQARSDESVTPTQINSARALTEKLEKAGVDVDGLLAQRSVIAERGRAVIPLLNGLKVRIPGYLLPLEFSGRLVSEFLLVPWVGACIHTPPPPPNQIVHVVPEKPVEMAGMFAPVWVTGELKTGEIQKSLSMIDGTSDIDIGYSIRATDVSPYK